VLFVTLVFDGVRPSDGQEHGQGHGQANKQGIRQSPSLKIYILTISTPPVILQLFLCLPITALRCYITWVLRHSHF
jgi:hypothetical protein